MATRPSAIWFWSEAMVLLWLAVLLVLLFFGRTAY